MSDFATTDTVLRKSNHWLYMNINSFSFATIFEKRIVCSSSWVMIAHSDSYQLIKDRFEYNGHKRSENNERKLH